MPLREDYARDGFLHIKNFCTPEECQQMIGQMTELVRQWDPAEEKAPTFRTDDKQVENQGSSDYFLDSGDKIHFFLEAKAAEEDGSLKSGVEKLEALNKVGHGLHVVDPVFRDYAQSVKVKALVKELGYQDPVLPQSMYIFKQAGIGGEVTSHQDSTFLYTTPRQTCMGLWLALEDATKENGCVWARPGSHLEPVRRRFYRNPTHFAGDKEAPQLIFEDFSTPPCPGDTWEGKMPADWDKEGLEQAGFLPVECNAGDLVVIHGQVDHLSKANLSGKSRHTFQLHLVEGPGAGVTWHPENWLQYEGFPSLTLDEVAPAKI
mmetsp:Transcript_35273/g.77212  ORF Transcript_35273/g.77212 Transcript_35273/m.77212 type:complete len:319 (-) Transcript_35273:421-1377(-)